MYLSLTCQIQIIQIVVSEWLEHLDKTTANINDETIFIGHSLGCITAMKFILKKNIKVKAAFFVSGFIDENPMDIKTDGLQSFFNDPLDIKSLINLVPNRIAITALDDDIVPSNATKKMAEKIDAQLIELNCGKHFIDKDGYIEIPILLNIIKKIN